MAFEVNKAVSDIYIKMGNLSKSQVDLPVVLSRLYSVINRRLAQYNLSTTNWILNFVDVYSSSEYRNPLPVSDFSNAVTVELDRTDGDFSNYAEEIDIVNPLNINTAHHNDKRAIGFYQNQDEGNWYYVTSFREFNGTLRIWYEPDSPVPNSLNSSVMLKRLFMDMITSETAYYCMPYAKGIDTNIKNDIKMSLKEDYFNWEQEWKEELQKGRQQKLTVRTPFRAGF